jgi:hypothetical protein
LLIVLDEDGAESMARAIERALLWSASARELAGALIDEHRRIEARFEAFVGEPAATCAAHTWRQCAASRDRS